MENNKDEKNTTNKKELKIIKKIDIENIPIALDYYKGELVVGLYNGDIVTVSNEDESKIIMRSHHDGEVWGLAVDEKTGYVLTTGDDNKIMVYDPKQHRVVKVSLVEPDLNKKPRKVKGGASSLSKHSVNQQSRAIAVNSLYKHVALASNDGIV